ncbi:MerR family transcriptional regulator [Microbacterium binotii]|uniref:MerR family transcriptional regulator n=1 Tax=Microbacterium binotii TaxID=462710 RepID=UPI001F2381FF|nr:MerR family transcriptional regulator [Microbacterium binotii]UIN30919.1 hypothetical protein LXM64_01550 [Microbacterium binotii]
MPLTIWLTYFEAADRAGVPVRTIRDWVAVGLLTPQASRFRASDVTECALRAREARE